LEDSEGIDHQCGLIQQAAGKRELPEIAIKRKQVQQIPGFRLDV
jgi:hypothetical protein